MNANPAEARRVVRPQPQVRVDFLTGDLAEGEERAMVERLRLGPGLSE